MSDGPKIDLRDVLTQADRALEECLLALTVRYDANIGATVVHEARRARLRIGEALAHEERLPDSRCSRCGDWRSTHNFDGECFECECTGFESNG